MFEENQVGVVELLESGLRTLDHGDLAGPDSRGLFQQRTPWGPLHERMNPARSARLFYTGGHAGQPGLLDIPDWEHLPLARVANAVQHSAHPDAYAHYEDEATALVTTVALTGQSPASDTSPETLTGCPQNDGTPAQHLDDPPAGYTIPVGTSPAAATAITWALTQLGTPYSYGGDCTAAHSADPTRQCDCSSLVQTAYHAAGIILPRSTIEQVHTGVHVSLGDLQAGDLIFIPGSDGTPANPRHVGLYLGANLIIHAPQTGRDVEITRLDGWQPRIAQIRRPTQRVRTARTASDKTEAIIRDVPPRWNT